MKRPPPYVSALYPDHLRVSYARQKLRDAIRQGGYECTRDEYGFNVRFPRGRIEPDDPALVELMRFLNALDLPFGEDYKVPLAPADLMRGLQKRRLVPESFRRIGWYVPPDGYVVEEVAPPGATEGEDPS